MPLNTFVFHHGHSIVTVRDPLGNLGALPIQCLTTPIERSTVQRREHESVESTNAVGAIKGSPE